MPVNLLKINVQLVAETYLYEMFEYAFSTLSQYRNFYQYAD